MTTPQPVEQQPPGGLTAGEVAALAALALFLATPAAAAAAALPAALTARLIALGLDTRAVRAASRLVMGPPLTGRRRYGSPTARTTTARAVAADEPTMRARYIVAAARRLTGAARLGVVPEALRQEGQHLRAHVAAGRNRARAAAELDRIADLHGPWLVWDATLDDRTTADCADLHGTLFTIDNLPKGQIPGAVHPRCRCRPAPFIR